MTDPRESAAYLRGVRFTYDTAFRPAVRGIDLCVQRGEMVVILGPTGAGKSTLAKILNRTIPAFQSGKFDGEVWLLGQRCERETVADFAGRIGLVAQDFEAQLFSSSVADEVAFGLEQLGVPREEMLARVDRSLAAVGLIGFQERDPATLSGGEKQRLAIAAMLALEPELLVLDEPTTDLDPAGKEEVLAVLAALRESGRTLVVVEHETLAAEMADRVLLLHDGCIAATGPPEVLLRDVALLERCAVRPPDLPLLAARCGWSDVPRSVSEATERLAVYVAPRGRSVPAGPQLGQCEQEVERGAGAGWNPVLEAKEVTLMYEDSNVPALECVSVAIWPGEFVALLGQNGSGKTSLAKCLNGLQAPSAGTVLLDGEPILNVPLARRASSVSYVFQNPDHQIFAARVYDEVAFGPTNIGLSREDTEERVHEALQAVGLLGRIDDDPFWLTKGERQRLAVASLLALRPRVLILDEPTTGLDARETRQVMEVVRALHAAGLAVVMITHAAWLVSEYAERAILLHRGTVLFDGRTAELFRHASLVERAHFRVPPIVQLGQRWEVFTPTVDAFLSLFAPGKDDA